MVVAVAPIVYTAAAFLALYVGSANRYFVPDACERLEHILEANVVGQKLASSLFVEAVCSHLQNKNPVRPLVVSLHGPPGVGKTLSHYLAARALYGLDGGSDSMRLATLRGAHRVKRAIQKQVPLVKEAGAILETFTGNPIKCPGSGCAGYKVLYGLDFIKQKKERQHGLFREAVLAHAKRFPESLIVVEEYDKLDCETRAMFRQLMNHPEAANVSLGKSIIVLESNLGMHEVQVLMQKAGSRERVEFHSAYHILKEMMCKHWAQSQCEEHRDSIKLSNLIDAFIPYFPLERVHIRKLFEMKLKEMGEKEVKQGVQWSKELVDYLMQSIQFEGAFSIDGAKDTEGPLRRVYHALSALKKDIDFNRCLDKIPVLSIDSRNSRNSLQLSVSCQSYSASVQ